MFRRFVLIAVLVCASSEKVCRIRGRIVGGEETTIQKFPHQVALFYYGEFFCGGSIISKTVIVTAAHCTQRKSTSSFKVLAGSTRRSGKGVRIRVKQIISHEDFSFNGLDNDIALLILAKALEFSDSIKPIPLVESGEEAQVGDIAYVSGWGALRVQGPIPDTLRYVAVYIIDSQKCSEAYENDNAKIYESMICAGVAGGGKDSCAGDSGGPLISNGKLIGIVSGGIGCGHEKYPGVYARVSYLRDWIEKNRPDK